MPFVPLGSRKRLEVILDDDKVQMTQKQQERDRITMNRYYGAAPGDAGYRFAKHPSTMGFVRGPDPPFKGATSTWRPPSADPNGPAGQRDKEQSDYGAVWEAAHSMRKTRSSPSLASTGIEACHPMATELRRWERLGQVTLMSEMKDIELPQPKQREPEHPKPRKVHRVGGLVNFPKYMLIHNCHLKQQDMQRFQREQEELARLAEEAEQMGIEAQTPVSVESSVKWQEASWGAPLLKREGHHWAGSAMPAGRSQRTSNPFRTG